MDMQGLYREVIMEHYKHPHHKGLKGYKQVHLRNPSCGDDIYVEADIKNGKIVDVCHDGHGCAICCSSASIMCDLLSSKTIEEANEIITNYYHMLEGKEFNSELLDEAAAYQGVAQFPARIKCATIAWKAMEEILGDKKDE